MRIYEYIKLENADINITLPDSVTGFKIPADAPVKEYNWQ